MFGETVSEVGEGVGPGVGPGVGMEAGPIVPEKVGEIEIVTEAAAGVVVSLILVRCQQTRC